MPAPLEGALTIHVNWDGRRVRGATVASSRPLHAASALVGRSPADAVAMVPLLFAICGRAQAVAAALACERASGVETAAPVAAARAELVAGETVHEYLWRMLLDWTRATGERGDTALLADLRRRIAAAADASRWALRFAPDAGSAPPSGWVRARSELLHAVAERVLCIASRDWRDVTGSLDRFNRWIAVQSSPAARLFARLVRDAPAFASRRVALMPQVAPLALATGIAPRLDAVPRFTAEPDWEGSCRETGALARQQAHPLVAALGSTTPSPVLPRTAARLVELGALLGGGESPRIGAVPLAANDAIAWAETARGLLLHRVAVAEGVVARYQIVAPTEWNFHPRGALATELAGMEASDADVLRERVDMLVQSLDPCVAYSVEIGKAPGAQAD